MKYDFTSVINRAGTGSIKWDDMLRKNPSVNDEALPMSIADMEFYPAPQIVQGLKNYLDTAVLGYTHATNSYYEAVVRWMGTRHNYTIEKDWVIVTPGVVPALFQMVKAFTNPGDGVIVMPPVYFPFMNAIRANGRHVVDNPLVIRNDSYEIDYEGLERVASEPGNTLLLLSNPHNPAGRVWTREELERICQICLKNGVFVVCDEIHQDIIMPGNHHTVYANVSAEASENCAVCTAPSKTFNLAAMYTSNIIIQDPKRRKAMIDSMGKSSLFCVNALGYRACEIAYNECGQWLDGLIEVIDSNRKLAEDIFARDLPQARVYPLEGTYLLWVDFGGIGIDQDTLEQLFYCEAQVFPNDGRMFGQGGEGFFRFNIACPSTLLEKALNRIGRVLKNAAK